MPEERAVTKPFRPGDVGIWWKRVSGEFVFPVRATGLAVTARRVKVAAEDTEEGPESVVRYISPSSLQHHDEQGLGSPGPPPNRVRRG